MRSAALQRQLLDRAAAYLRPGGVLVYSTCSVMREENEDIVDYFLAHHRECSIRRPPAGIAPALVDGNNFFRTNTSHEGMDGFFGAILQKTAG